MIHLIPVIPITQPVSGTVDLLSLISVLIPILLIPLLLRAGWNLGSYIVKRIDRALFAQVETFDVMSFLEGEKAKQEPCISFFDPPTEEPNYVVGFGADGEMIYASEKPKRKNDEVSRE